MQKIVSEQKEGIEDFDKSVVNRGESGNQTLGINTSACVNLDVP